MKRILFISFAIIVSVIIFFRTNQRALALDVDDRHPAIGGAIHVLDANADHFYSVFWINGTSNAGGDACANIEGKDLVVDNDLTDYGTCFVNDNGNFQVVELSEENWQNYNDSLHDSSFVDKLEVQYQNKYLFDFSLTNGGNKSVTAENSVTNSITATLNSGTPNSVIFYSPLGLPDGAEVFFSPDSCTPTCSTTMNISTSVLTPAGTYTIYIVGSAKGAIAQATSFTLTVNPAVFNFSLSNSGLAGVTQGSSVTNLITATLVSGITKSVSFSASGLPTGATASFSPASCNPTCSVALNISTATSTAPGSYPITVTATGGGVTKTTSFTLTVNAIPFNFSISDEGGKSVTVGQSVTSTITATLVAGTTQSVTYSASGLPAGATALFSPTSCSPTCSTTLTISTSLSTPSGNYTITVSGTGGGVTKTTAFALAINPIPFNFSLSDGGGKSVTANESVTNVITATLVSGSSQSVSFSVSGLPSGATGVFSSTSCTPTCSTTLTISTAASTPSGNYTIIVTGTGVGVTKTTAFTLAVNEIPSFSLSNEGNKSVTVGQSVTNTVTATLVSGTAKPVTFSVSGVPTGATASFSQSSCTPTCSTILTITTSGSVASNEYTITVSGTDGLTTKTNSFTITVNPIPFNFSLSDTGNRSATAGQSVLNVITATHVAGTAQSVSFSASGLPTGATASFSPSSCTATCSTTLTITTPATASGGNYSITISATGGGVTKTTAFTIELAEPSTQTSENTIPITLGGEVVLATSENNQFSLTVPQGSVTPDGATDLQLIVNIVQQQESIYVAPPGKNDYTLGLFDVNIIKKTILNGVVVSTSSVTSFGSPITLRFSWVESTLPAGVSETDQEFGWWDTNNAWHDVTGSATWDFVNNHVTYTTDHLTRFALVAAASASASPPPPPAPPTTVSLPRSSFFVWELQGGEIVGLRPGCNEAADLNSDARVNLIDFSILAYWRSRSNAPSSLDINRDGKVDVADLSILIYCWVR